MADLAVPPEVVVELRRGLLVAMGTAAERLAVLTLPGRLTHLSSYESSLWAIDATKLLLGRVGVEPQRRERIVRFGEDEYPRVLYSVLRDRHETLRNLREDAAVSTGRRHEAADDELIGEYVASLRQRLTGGSREREERHHLVRSNTVH